MNFASKAQTWVTIPDSNFVYFLQYNYPFSNFMSGNQMDITHPDVQNIGILSVAGLNIADLTGIEYFTNLQELICYNNQLTSLPSLPNSLQKLYCENNQLTSLPTLPNSLQELVCDSNQLTILPTLSNSLTYLSCNNNQLASLPTLPNSIIWLYCGNNQLTSLPTLSNSLKYLACGNNQLTSLPTLPTLLETLECRFNQLTSLPTLPNSIESIYCNNNLLTSLPTLPNTPFLLLFCGNNQLTNLPTLPDSYFYLNCDSNNISCFPIFPSLISNLSITGNPFTCLPNYVLAMDSATLTYPLCISGDTINNPNGCDGLNCFANYTTTYDSVQNMFTLTIDPNTTNMATSYHWDFGDGTSSILATPSHMYTVDSLYNVCMKIFTTSGDSCTYCHILGIDSLGNIIRSPGFTLNVQNATSIIDIFQSNSDYLQISIYPNPFTSQTTVSFNKEMKNSSIKIVDMLGKTTNEIYFSGKQLIIEKGSMNAGIYFLQAIDENKNLVNKKIIIE